MPVKGLPLTDAIRGYLVGLEKVPSRFTRHPALMQGFAAAA
jgi:hypothetical protein